jgi:hypothetical protein
MNSIVKNLIRLVYWKGNWDKSLYKLKREYKTFTGENLDINKPHGLIFWFISQKFGLSMDSLVKLNRFSKQFPKKGSKIYLIGSIILMGIEVIDRYSPKQFKKKFLIFKIPIGDGSKLFTNYKDYLIWIEDYPVLKMDSFYINNLRKLVKENKISKERFKELTQL